MKTLAIAAIIAGILLIASFAVVKAVSNETPATEKPITGCSSCGGACSAGNNCGLATCGAVSGKGTCDCGK